MKSVFIGCSFLFTLKISLKAIFFFWTRFYSLEENIPLNFCMDRASKPRRGKREGAWRKLACIGKDNPETNRKHWRVQHHSVYLNNQVFTTWRKVHSEGTSANYSAFAAWLLSLEMKRREEHWVPASQQFTTTILDRVDLNLGDDLLNISSLILWIEKRRNSQTAKTTRYTVDGKLPLGTPRRLTLISTGFTHTLF